MVRKGINPQVHKPLEAWVFYEFYCPICNYLINHIMKPLASANQVKLLLIEINSQSNTSYVAWYNYYSNMVGEAITPTIRMVDRYFDANDMRYNIIQVKVIHVWKQKSTELKKEDEEKAETVQNHIFEATRTYRRPPSPMSHKTFPPRHVYYTGMDIKQAMMVRE